jgi:hypothetical protein
VMTVFLSEYHPLDDYYKQKRPRWRRRRRRMVCEAESLDIENAPRPHFWGTRLID